MKPIWNAHVVVDNAQNMVGLGWGVTDDVSGSLLDYDALITLALPQRVHAIVQKKAPNETVVLNGDPNLACGPNTIDAIVTYRVTPNKPGANGSQVVVNIANNAGQKPLHGGVLAQATGQVGQDIKVRFVIPGNCA
jgi:hypothetical protein